MSGLARVHAHTQLYLEVAGALVLFLIKLISPNKSTIALKCLYGNTKILNVFKTQ